MALHCQIWLFVPLLLILLNKHNLDSQRGDRVCVDMAMDTLHGTLGTRPIPSEGLFNLHQFFTTCTDNTRPGLENRTFTCKSIKIIAPILLVCIELNPGPQNVTSVGNQLKPMPINLFTVTTAPTGSIVTVVTLMTANTGS